jgi:hypothetical protein
MPNSKHLTHGISNLVSLIIKTKLRLSNARPSRVRSRLPALAAQLCTWPTRARPCPLVTGPATPGHAARLHARALSLSLALVDRAAPPVIPVLPLLPRPAMTALRPASHHDAGDTIPTNMIYMTPRSRLDTLLGRRHARDSSTPAMAARWPRCPLSRQAKSVATKLKA